MAGIQLRKDHAAHLIAEALDFFRIGSSAKALG
jgi:hypothetical protein